MITHWQYNGSVKNLIGDVKKLISDNNYKTIDIGASLQFWSYPECKFVADIVKIEQEGVKFFDFNIQNKNTWTELLNYVEEHGKFDYSICSHTLEDVITPTDLLELLPRISKKGYIAIPSKYNEFMFLWDNKYRGNAHHKQIIDVKDDMICIYPKYPFIEVFEETDKVLENNLGNELVVFWEDKIPYKFFAQDNIFHSDGDLIKQFYKQISSN
jgi:hypothetical protein